MTRSPDLPEKDENESDEDYSKKCQKWESEYYQKIDDIAMKRQEQFENIAFAYDAVVGSYIENVDSFSVRVSITGEGLRDLVQNYGYIFEVIEAAEVKMESSVADTSPAEDELQFYKPEIGSPIIGAVAYKRIINIFLPLLCLKIQYVWFQVRHRQTTNTVEMV